MSDDSFELLQLPDDGLLTPTIRPHSLEKYRAISYILKIFSTSMKSKWNNRVYIDLFSGAGRSKLESSGIIVPGSPLLALGVEDRFDKYIFCEKKPEFYDVLNQRVSAICEPEKFKIIQGDVNQNAESILEEIPEFGKDSSCLSFCLVDPYKIGQLNFKTIKDLSSVFMDFLVLIPSYMDVRRNKAIYLREEDSSISTFVGDSRWRQGWLESESKGMKIGLFILDYFGKKMKEIGYLYPGPEDAFTIYVDQMGVPLYHLYLFSKNQRGVDFWRKTTIRFNDQLKLL
jgi:three-Cys-motif partner protein